MSEPVLYRWPDAARFGRVVPKTKFYEHAHVATKTRDRFVAEVRRITWAYKLAEQTVHLPASQSVPEIQVFVVEAKIDDVSDTLLMEVDKAVPFPIIFEIVRQNDVAEVRTVAGPKHLGEVSPRKVSGYFTGDWQPADAIRRLLPTALSLAELYERLLEPLLPVTPRPEESVAGAAERVAAARKVERDLARLQQRVRNEPQFNRKVELRHQIRDLETQLTELTSPSK